MPICGSIVFASAIASQVQAAGGVTRNASAKDFHVTMADYPAVARAAGEHGRTAVSFTVDEQGSVLDCVVTRSSGSKVLDKQSCSILARTHFVPARGQDGRSVAQHWSWAIEWADAERREIRMDRPVPLE